MNDECDDLANFYAGKSRRKKKKTRKKKNLNCSVLAYLKALKKLHIKTPNNIDLFLEVVRKRKQEE